MVFAIAYLSLDVQILQQEILCKHPSDIGIDLSDCIHILHVITFYANFASTPFTKEAEESCPNFFASSTASLIATPVGMSSSYSIS